MAVRKITKLSEPKQEEAIAEESVKVEEVVKAEEVAEAADMSEKTGLSRKPSKKVCFFCDQQKSPDYTDASNLRRFLNDRARIVPKMRTGVCAKHQRRLAKEIKYARHLALLPFVVKV